MYRHHNPDQPGMHLDADDPRSYTTYRRRREETFCERVRSSLLAVIVGFVIITAATIMTFLNEGRAVQTRKSLDEGLSKVIKPSLYEMPHDHSNGRLIYLSGPIQTGEILTDAEYGVQANAAHLKRIVEMYQWVEHSTSREERDNEGNVITETTYTYSKDWSSTLIESSAFSESLTHVNPKSFAVLPKIQTAPNVGVGQFLLSPNLLQKIGNYKSIVHVKDPKNSTARVYKGKFYHAEDPANPEIGDLRVYFQCAGRTGHGTLAEPDYISVVGKQEGSHIVGYQTEAGDILEILYMGKLFASEIFAKEHVTNNFATWGLRFAGWLLMFIGFSCLTRIIITLVDQIPVIREVVGFGVHTLNLTLSMSLSLLVIALGWIRYRPLVGCAILVCSLLPFIYNKLRYRARRNYMNSRSYVD